MTEEELQAHVDEKYSGMQLTVRANARQPMVLQTFGYVGFGFALDMQEPSSAVKSRLRIALEEAKTLIEQDIEKLK